MAKEVKTNAMRILDRAGVKYDINLYECDQFIDGVHIADMLGQDYSVSYKTLVASGKNGGYFVFVIPVDKEVDLKSAATAVSQKAVSLIPVKDITAVTGYIRGGCTCVGMKKQYPTIIDLTALEHERIIVSGGRIGAQIIISPHDLANVASAKFANIIHKV